jgi:hypothetical protein
MKVKNFLWCAGSRGAGGAAGGPGQQAGHKGRNNGGGGQQAEWQVNRGGNNQVGVGCLLCFINNGRYSEGEGFFSQLGYRQFGDFV